MQQQAAPLGIMVGLLCAEMLAVFWRSDCTLPMYLSSQLCGQAQEEAVVARCPAKINTHCWAIPVLVSAKLGSEEIQFPKP